MGQAEPMTDTENRYESGERSDQAPGKYRVWVDNEAAFSTRRVSAIRHNFHEHPLMQLPQLAELAKALFPTKQCRFIKPGMTQASEFTHADTAHDGRDIDEVFRRIEEPGSWIALYDVQTHPPYRQFIDEVIATVRPLVEREEPGIFNAAGFIFVSAPPSVTPFHIDRENNFWLQIKGRKTMNVWDHTDRTTVAATAVEEFILRGSLQQVQLKEELRQRSHEFNTSPGDGVYFPSTSPHMTQSGTEWTKPGDGVSVSIGVVFYTSVSRRHAYAHALNYVLRKLGVSPTEPGRSEWLDRLKYPFARIAWWVLRHARDFPERNGF